jgi:hypothetical protein
MLSFANILNLSLDLLIIGAMTFLGALIVLSASPRQDFLAVLLLGFPIGSAVLTWTIFLTSWVGFPITIATWLIIYIAFLVVIKKRIKYFFELPIFQKVFWKEQLSSSASQSRLGILVVMLIGLAVVVAVGGAYSTWDAAGIWSAKGYGIALEKTIFAGQTWGAHGLSYPLHIPLVISFFQTLNGDLLPGSKIIFPMLYMSMLLGAYRYWRLNQSQPLTAILGLLLLGTTPFVFSHAIIGYANLPFSSYMALATLWGIEGLDRNSKNAILLSSVLFAFAAWTRPEGFYLSSLSLATIWLAGKFIYRKALPLRNLLLPFLTIVVPWLIFLSLYGLNAQLPSLAVASIGEIARGNLNLAGLGEVIRYFFEQTLDLKTWGVLYPLAALIAVLNFPKLRQISNRSILTLFLVFITISVSVVTLYYITSFSELGLDWWLPSGFNRMLMPASLLLGVFCIQLSQANDSQEGSIEFA